MHKDICRIRKKLKNKHFPVRQRPFLRKINLENGGGCGIMKYRKEGPVYGRIPYESGFLTILLDCTDNFSNTNRQQKEKFNPRRDPHAGIYLTRGDKQKWRTARVQNR